MTSPEVYEGQTMSEPKPGDRVSDRLRVVFLPQWYGNPYQRRLDEELTSLGVRVGRFEQDLLSVVRGLARNRPDVLHLHWLHPLYEMRNKQHSRLRLTFSLAMLGMLRGMGVRIVWTAHNLGHHEAIGTSLDRRCTEYVIKHARGIIVHSPSARARLLETYPSCDPSKLRIIPHGNYVGCYPDEIDRQAARARLNLPDDHTVILFFGQVRPYKGVLDLVEAFRSVSVPNSTLVIAGNPMNQEAADLMHEAVAGADNIRFVPGFVADEDIQVYMSAAHACVLPYKDILTSGAAILAMSFGKAILAPRLGCFTDMLDASHSILYDLHRPDALSEALAQAGRSPRELDEMGRKNKELADTLSWDGIARQTLDLYETAVRR